MAQFCREPFMTNMLIDKWPSSHCFCSNYDVIETSFYLMSKYDVSMMSQYIKLISITFSNRSTTGYQFDYLIDVHLICCAHWVEWRIIFSSGFTVSKYIKVYICSWDFHSSSSPWFGLAQQVVFAAHVQMRSRSLADLI